MPDKQEILEAIAAMAKRLGRVPNRTEFSARSGVSQFFVMQWFRSWNDAVKAAGLRPYAQNKKIADHALLEDWGKAVRRRQSILPRHIYRSDGKYNPCTLAKHFGGWGRVPEAFRNFAKGQRQWADVVALLPGRKTREKAMRNKESACAISPNNAQHAQLMDRPTYGDPFDFRGLRHEPVNEQGVVLLFGMVAKELGYLVEAVQTGFPDCEAKRQIAPGRWQRVRIEFEFESRKFRDHGHLADGCDVIVCWRHNWPECPEHIDVVELSKVIKTLAGRAE